MRSKITILFLFTSIHFGYSQEPNFNKAIGTSCFFAGSSTKIVLKYEELLKSNKVETIKKELFSNEAEDRLLSVLVLEALISVDKIQVSEEEILQIKRIKQSDAEVYTCSGCTLMQKVTLKDFFLYPTSRTQIQVDLWLENYIDGYKNRLSRL